VFLQQREDCGVFHCFYYVGNSGEEQLGT
jgi:hypothetical protein